MILETPRLRLRPFTQADLDDFLAYRQDPEIARYQGWTMPYTREMATGFIADMMQASPDLHGDWYQLAIQVIVSGRMIGDVAYAVRDSRRQQAEIGVTLARPYHGQGYAREAILRLLAYLFDERGLHRVFAACDPANPPAFRLLESLGFRREGHFVENFWDRDHWTDEYFYALLEREWRERQGG